MNKLNINRLNIYLYYRMNEPYYIYRLYGLNINNNKCHYIGSTPQPRKRIRQHNGIIVGGAKCTKMKINSLAFNENTNMRWNYDWILMTHLDNKNALSLEWHLKYPFDIILNNPKKKTNYNVNLNGEIFKYRCYKLNSNINTMLKQIDITIQYVIEKKLIFDNNMHMYLLLDVKLENIEYKPINYKLIYVNDLTNSILNNLLDNNIFFN